jgi:RNA polymerase sigma-70 factor (ECF subfamily)
MELNPDGSLVVDATLSMSSVSEEELSRDAAEMAGCVRLTLGGDTAAFEYIIRRYETRVMTLAARLLGGREEARDVAQEVFLRAFKYLHRLDLRKPVEPWLIRITVNVCHDARRRTARRRCTFVTAESLDPVDRSPDAFSGVARDEERQMLKCALDTLPEKQRLAIILRDVEGLSTGEVASILQSSETTVRSQVSRGRLKLKATIERLIGGRP